MTSRVVIVGGGPGGYEAAIVARKAGAEVTLIERQGLGGNAVLTDVVPSKTVIATAEWLTIAGRAPELGIADSDGTADRLRSRVDMAAVNERIRKLVLKQSHDISLRMAKNDINVVQGEGRLVSSSRVVTADDEFEADAILLALGASPRIIPGAEPDGERILTWTQLYDLTTLPEHLIVVGSGVTGAEFAGAYNLLGSQVTLVSSGDRVLSTQDPEASALITETFARRGMEVLGRARASKVVNQGDSVVVFLEDGRVVEGSHCLMAVGSVPNTSGVGLADAGVELDARGYVSVDKVSRTSARGIYAAGDCTGVLPLASVAATQGRIAIAHALGDAVTPLEKKKGRERGRAARAWHLLPGVSPGAATQSAREDARHRRGLREDLWPHGYWPGAGRGVRGDEGLGAHLAARARGVAPPHSRRHRGLVHGVPVAERNGGRSGPPPAPHDRPGLTGPTQPLPTLRPHGTCRRGGGMGTGRAVPATRRARGVTPGWGRPRCRR